MNEQTETAEFVAGLQPFFFSPLSANILVQPRLQPTHEAVHLRDLAAPIPDEGQLAHHQLWLNPFPRLYN